MYVGSITKVNLAAALLLGLAACRSTPQRTPAIGEAYAGPPLLKIRSDIPTQSAAVATVHHGERLEILGRRRSFFRVRTSSGAEGWTDQRQLLAASDMASLKDLAAHAAKMPAQGQGTANYGELRVHIQPSRLAPGFLVIKEGEKVDVLMHVTMPRTETPRAPLLPPKPKNPKTAPQKRTKEPKYPLPPLPKPPAPPADWLDLSKTDLPDEDTAPSDEVKGSKPTPEDDWSLVRTAGGQSGWVLTSPLRMAIPDEVAQYAEGHRIVSYFPLGEVRDEDAKKTIWLWTTIGGGRPPYDFDSFRVFIWSLRHHRYETAYIERNLKGFQPVLLGEVDLAAPGRKTGADAAARYPGFSICVEKSDGSRRRREYALLGNVVRFAGDRPCEPPAPLPEWRVPAPPSGLAADTEAPTAPAPQPGESFSQRVKKRLRSLTRGWFGR